MNWYNNNVLHMSGTFFYNVIFEVTFASDYSINLSGYPWQKEIHIVNFEDFLFWNMLESIKIDRYAGQSMSLKHRQWWKECHGYWNLDGHL